MMTEYLWYQMKLKMRIAAVRETTRIAENADARITGTLVSKEMATWETNTDFAYFMGGEL